MRSTRREDDPRPKADTADTVAAIQATVLRGLSPKRRLELAVKMSLAARALLAARLHTQYADRSEAQVGRQVLHQTLAPVELPPVLR